MTPIDVFHQRETVFTLIGNHWSRVPLDYVCVWCYIVYMLYRCVTYSCPMCNNKSLLTSTADIIESIDFLLLPLHINVFPFFPLQPSFPSIPTIRCSGPSLPPLTTLTRASKPPNVLPMASRRLPGFQWRKTIRQCWPLLHGTGRCECGTFNMNRLRRRFSSNRNRCSPMTARCWLVLLVK